MLHYIKREPKIESQHPPLLILIHGYGSNEQDLFSFANELPDEFLILSVQAPYEMGYGGYAWYAIDFNADDEKFSDLVQAKASIEKLVSFIDYAKKKYNTNPNKTFLLGFSQGAILSYAISMNYPNKVEYVVALSGYLNEDLLPEETHTPIDTDYYISHGTSDQVIPIDWAKKACEYLDNLGLTYRYSDYPVGHGVSPQNFFDFKKWLEARI